MENLLKKYQKFIFLGHQFDRESGTLFLRYSLDGEINFEEKLIFPVAQVNWELVDNNALSLSFNALLLAGGISYYKTYCPSQMEVQTETLSEEQTEFWNKFYQRGLGEFFFRSQIDFRGLINFPFEGGVSKMSIELNLQDRCLVPIGGGKDSIVTGEILKTAGETFTLFTLRESEPIKKTSEILGMERLVVGRELAPELLDLNAQGAYNGHIPITGYISFILASCAILYDYKNLVMSLEKSANYGNFEYLEMEINHQYSKSEEFEGDFRNYLKNFVTPSIEYFSLLRKWHELKIVELFSDLKNHEKYLPVFTSCNMNFKILKGTPGTEPGPGYGAAPTLWCGKCPKCAFVFLLMAAFLPKAKILKAFGKNLFADASLIGLYRELLGLENFKPFECVGTPEECYLAFVTVVARKEFSHDPVVKMFLANQAILQEKSGEEEDLSLNPEEENEGQYIPEKYKKILSNY